jgi:hypothetical protein
MRAAARKRAPFPDDVKPAGPGQVAGRVSRGEAGNAWTFCPLPSYTARIRDAPGSDAARIITAGADSASITRCLYERTRVGRRAPEGGGRAGS